ncbi:MAG: TatD family hydrolase [Verrucomicrobium sp.]|jgi:TatD DNase family protein|nr:TatD family hydrolase [Verrucomicrobium sp.]
MRWHDAHNHLQDPRLGDAPATRLAQALSAGVAGMVVNGTCETDWPTVLHLAERFAEVIPAFGLHPWRVPTRSACWLETLEGFLDRCPGAGVGEVGLDGWILDQSAERCLELGIGPSGPAPMPMQVEALDAQLDLAATRGLPVSLHCLRAWGPLLDRLRNRAPLPRGFLLHSYGGSRELVPELVRLGAHFSLSGHSLHPRKADQLAVFRAIPRDRWLVETDAPDQLPPPEWISHPANGPGGRPVNSPANLPRIAIGLATHLGVPAADLAALCEANWRRFFGRPASGT